MTTANQTDAQMKLADVTQADREAAADFFECSTFAGRDAFLRGDEDSSDVVQAFAKHRQATEARAQGLVEAERERCLEIAKNELIKCKKRTWGWYICWRIHEAIRSQHSQHGGERER